MAKLDLHCHSTASDGALPPAELVARAAARGSRMLALTDHDCTAGLAEAGEAAREHGLDLIRGVEISVSWRTRTIHIVGLDIDPDCPALAAGLRAVRALQRFDFRPGLTALACPALMLAGAADGAARVGSRGAPLPVGLRGGAHLGGRRAGRPGGQCRAAGAAASRPA